jgi:hypothetical protein
MSIVKPETPMFVTSLLEYGERSFDMKDKR